MNNYAIVQFFGLDVDQLVHLFTLGKQIQASFGGLQLTKLSKPRDVAENIFQFIEKMPKLNAAAQIYFTRRVLIEKIIFNKIISKKKKRRT